MVRLKVYQPSVKLTKIKTDLQNQISTEQESFLSDLSSHS